MSTFARGQILIDPCTSVIARFVDWILDFVMRWRVKESCAKSITVRLNVKLPCHPEPRRRCRAMGDKDIINAWISLTVIGVRRQELVLDPSRLEVLHIHLFLSRVLGFLSSRSHSMNDYDKKLIMMLL